jgi:hypothetical protein
MKAQLTAKDLIFNLKRNFLILLSREVELTDKEKLKNLQDSSKEDQRLKDIKAIRESGDYIPNYNKPKKYTDYQLAYDTKESVLYVDQDLKPHVTEQVVTKFVSPETKIACERPVDFMREDGSLINAVPRWMEAVRKSYEEDKQKKKLAELQQVQHHDAKKEHYEFVMQKMMSVN